MYSPDEPCPAYHTLHNTPPLVRSNTITSANTSVTSGSSQQYLRRAPSRAQVPVYEQRETYLYTYHLSAGGVPAQFLVLVEPLSGQASAGKCSFSLSLKVNNVERSMGDPIELNLHVDPRLLEFVVFIFPGKVGLPASCLYSYRVWLRCNGVDHRIFGGDDLWIGKDPEFTAIEGASFARLRNITSSSQLYQALIGRAATTFTVRWKPLEDSFYEYTLSYEAGGVGAELTSWKLRIQGDPRLLTFTIYSVPMKSTPINACHRLRVWLRSLTPFPGASSPMPLPFNDSYIYQRLWKMDTFRVGSLLNFDSLGSKATMGFTVGEPQTILTSAPLSIIKATSLSKSTTRCLPPIPSDDEHSNI